MTWFKRLSSYITFYRAGFAIAIFGLLQFLVMAGIDSLGLIDIGTGLGLGLLMIMCFAFGGFLICAGLVVDVILWIQERAKSS